MRDQQLLRLPRHEKKHFVRGWNASAGVFTEPNPAQHPSADDTESMPAIVSPPSMQQPAMDSTTSTYRPIDTASYHEPAEQQSEPLPLTVWHVRHAYRARARRVEQASALKATDVIQGSRENLIVFRRSVQAKHPAKAVTSSIHASSTHEQGTSDSELALNGDERDRSPTDDADDDERGLCLANLSASRISQDAAHRDELLGVIRRHLAAGRRVTLRTNCAASRESVGDARLALQLLCSHSLLYCARDQSVVPEADGTLLELQLHPRVGTC